ncbi:MAG: 30S ribosomal protein S5 [Candidatus Doudnabacteria bacterium RIFCSPHIGHO2_01_FULL_50_67]|uniref:Small ribosomal subunit protein uS5 n=1 Tax=Candidatus Doudnabacteria bacterium RIFCSPHIGHO2_12_FULL_48_16 TaxID=1817838 RepID=A0A1F5PJ93_9BACT|nr:MAG: 30S ribosomal protein S5 [Candidatus Doudnabacteria bacterium RIFCSPHIGHO2_02_FULL_49_24]OGE88125.1 MAG: 30S ribosomal protein S5 [Candidatus Doudnabacteria bacterium RIFCSPHIGHO2_01_FULL_50_67]OGE89996.1 MAG: 30S ribosomal protein S5 [Candidatus Doudnabacteria bacterium RIFCSPHIGHO2_12_FULL_48_16]OGE96569.1 MAG: 30S ribosomal protein S5 [Candidatus Doudnabacteria bacterium RIFCSPLOWO2_01_FULL_49_40]
MAFNRGRGRGRQGEQGPREFEQKIVEIKRVTRVVAGGKRMRFRALVVIGDKKGRVGIGLRKGADVSEAVNKAVNAAKKTLVSINLVNDTIPHEMKLKYKSSVVFLKPARPGTGIIAGGSIRQVLDLVGVKNVLSKMIGSSNKVNNVMATYLALSKMKSKDTMLNFKK